MTSLSIVREHGDQAHPTVVFLPALGTSPSVWAPVIDILSERFHCVALGLPGHRGSTTTARSDESILSLASDVQTLAATEGWTNYFVAGISIGGAIALELALSHGDGLAGIAVCCSSPRIGSSESWQAREETVRGAGTGAVVDVASRRWFAPGFSERQAEIVGDLMNDLLHCNDDSYAALCGALATWDRRSEVSMITVPSLVISGATDEATPPEQSAVMSERMANSRYFCLPGVGHLASVEAPEVVAQLIDTLVSNTASTQEDPRVRGFRTRREVLGDEHVTRSQLSAAPENALFQEFITRYAWGDVWSREDLDRRSRSIATLSVLVAMGSEHELPMHIRAAQRHGLSVEEIGEIFLHVSLYAGLPRANAAFAILGQVVAEDTQ